MGIHLGISDRKEDILMLQMKGVHKPCNVHMLGKMGWFLISHNTDDFQLIWCHMESILSSTGWPGLFIITSHTFHWLHLDLYQDSGVWISVSCHHHANKLPRRWCHVVSGDTDHLSRSITTYDSYHCVRGAGKNRLEVHPEVTRNHEEALWDKPTMSAPNTRG